MVFCVLLYFVQGETLRKDVEILTCLDSIMKNAKNQIAWWGISFSLIYILQRPQPVSLSAATEWVGAEMKVCGAQICPNCLHIPQPTIFCLCVPPVMGGLLSKTLKIILFWKACECGQPANAWKALHVLKVWKKGGKHQWHCSRSVALVIAFIYTCLQTSEARISRNEWLA